MTNNFKKALMGMMLVFVTLISVFYIVSQRSANISVADENICDTTCCENPGWPSSIDHDNGYVFTMKTYTKNIAEVELICHFDCDVKDDNLDLYHADALATMVVRNAIKDVFAKISSKDIFNSEGKPCVKAYQKINNEVLTSLNEQYSAYVENCTFYMLDIKNLTSSSIY